MDGFNEKKWFIYLGDHHEGPFSLSEVYTQLIDGKVTTSNFAWAEGMADWKVITEIPEFGSIISLEHEPSLINASRDVGLESIVGPDNSDNNNGKGADNVSNGHNGVGNGNGGQNGNKANNGHSDPKNRVAQDPVVDAGLIDLSLSSESGMPMILGGEVSQNLAQTPISPFTVEGTISNQQNANTVVEESPLLESPPEVSKLAESGKKKSKPKKSKKGKSKEEVRKKQKLSFAPVFGLLFLFVITGGVAAYVTGNLDPVINSPIIRTAFLGVSEAFQPYVLSLAEKIPFLQNLVSPIQKIDSVSEDDYEVLQDAARSKFDPTAPKFGIVLSKVDPEKPTFYVASNLPDGSQFEIYLDGDPETLVGQLAFSIKAEAILVKRLGQTAPIQATDKTPIPAGKYKLYLVESESQPALTTGIFANLLPSLQPSLAVSGGAGKLPAILPKGRKLMIGKSFFLGGLRGTAYADSLATYHKTLVDQASREIADIKQFYTMLDVQLSTGISVYSQLHGGRVTASQRKVWEEFYQRWQLIIKALKSEFQKWTPAAFETDKFFYSVLYQATEQTGIAVEQVLLTFQSFFSSNVDRNAFDIQREQTISVARRSLSELKTKLEQAEKLGLTAGGLPRRDGL